MLAITLATPLWADNLANGVLLIAKRDNQDPNFRETVVLVTQHKHGGPVGVIINRPTEQNLSEIFPQFEPLQKSALKLYAGGPLSRADLVMVYRGAAEKSEALLVLPNVQMTNDHKLMEEALKQQHPEKHVRVYAGFAAWAKGQLEREIAHGDWLVLNADEETIFDKDPATIWLELIKRAGMRST